MRNLKNSINSLIQSNGYIPIQTSVNKYYHPIIVSPLRTTKAKNHSSAPKNSPKPTKIPDTAQPPKNKNLTSMTLPSSKFFSRNQVIKNIRKLLRKQLGSSRKVFLLFSLRRETWRSNWNRRIILTQKSEIKVPTVIATPKF